MIVDAGATVRFLLSLATAILLLGCTSDLAPISDCEPQGEIVPVCGMKTPEDIAAVPNGRHLLLSNFGGFLEGSGYLSLFDTQTESVTHLFPPAGVVTAPAQRDWGDQNCPPPEGEFRPHGTHLAQLASGQWRYLVVNHGERESIEMFALQWSTEGASIEWQGCVLANPDTIMNDVVGLSNGDLVFSRMLRDGSLIENLKNFVGIRTGDLWRWSQSTGLSILPGTEAAQPNGLELSLDEQHVFANMYFEKQVWKVDVDSGQVVAAAPVASADNSAWGSDGRLLIATHTGGVVEMLGCLDKQAQPCGASFDIVAMNPHTMETEVVFSHEGPPMGAATVAVPQGGRIYIGSFVGDRLMSVPDFSRTGGD